MKVLIATDGSEFSKAAVEQFCTFFPNLEKPEIKVVSVFEDTFALAAEPFSVSAEYYQQMVNAAQNQAKRFADDASALIGKRLNGASYDLTVGTLNGHPEQQIVELAEEWGADLIVVGSHGRGFWGRMLGSVSDAVVHHAPCSVLVVRKENK